MEKSSTHVSQWPMIATYSRIVFTPIIMLILTSDLPHAGWIASGIFVVASWTDWLDGFLARLLKAESNMGRFMDPIADKILILGCLLILLDRGTVSPWPVAVLVGRDIYIGGLRSVAAANNIVISARPLGKWKTATQMISLPCLFLAQPILGLPILIIGHWALWAAVALSIISGTEYIIGYHKGQR